MKKPTDREIEQGEKYKAKEWHCDLVYILDWDWNWII
jgi:hypothetical protein